MRWTTKPAAELTAQGHKVPATTVAKLLRASGNSLQANTKPVKRKQHLDRDAQFAYVNSQAKLFTGADDPVISVDTKKKLRIDQPTGERSQRTAPVPRAPTSVDNPNQPQ